MENATVYPTLQAYCEKLNADTISAERKKELQLLIDHLQQKVDKEEDINLNFICTHNSRRSQFAQLWSAFFADHFKLPISSYSGGVEITACNHRVINTLENIGFEVSGESDGDENPHYVVTFSEEGNIIVLYSKLFDDSFDQEEQFCAVMCCAHADDNCPFIPNAEARIPLRYEDPKAFDDTAKEKEMYLSRCTQIATEIKFIFSRIE